MTEKKTGKRYQRVLAAAVVLLTLFLAGCSPAAADPSPFPQGNEAGADLKVHFIDVGQGDSTLIEKDGHFMTFS